VPLNRLTRADQEFVFSESCTKAFKTLRAMLISTPILAHYDLDS
jgi:hypothetical protein